ncbi:MAG: nucleoside-diphosphate sugar epimerase [Roseburia sp. 40_7]|nr:MAG: nucleoside-diphosphate sugar epimerase [Roseburia sp. 40_7]
MKTVLVTGANGYMGRHVVTELLNLGCRVLVSDFSYDSVDERAIRMEEPIFDGAADIYEKMGKPDVCVHLAWRNGFVHNADTHIGDLPQHFEFLKHMIEGGLKHVAVMGSMHEVGYWEGAIDENTPCNPKSMYGIAKNALRQCLFSLPGVEDVCVQWLRAYYIIGDDLRNNSIFSKIVKLEEEGAETFPFTSGKNLYDFISIDELAYQIARVVTQEEEKGIIRPQYGAFPDRPYDSPGVWGNPEKINRILEKR